MRTRKRLSLYAFGGMRSLIGEIDVQKFVFGHFANFHGAARAIRQFSRGIGTFDHVLQKPALNFPTSESDNLAAAGFAIVFEASGFSQRGNASNGNRHFRIGIALNLHAIPFASKSCVHSASVLIEGSCAAGGAAAGLPPSVV